MQWNAICTLRNESDIVELFLRYHLDIFDKIYANIHLCLDNTEEIIQNLKKEGFPIEVRHTYSLRYCQGEVLTELLKEAALDSDWVMPLDADEFLTPREKCREIVESLTPDYTYFVRWKNYFPSPKDNLKEENILERLQHRTKIIDTNQHKVIIPSQIVRNNKVSLPEGSHEIYQEGAEPLTKRFKRGAVFAYKVLEEPLLAHFPVRSIQQMKNKSFVGWLAQVANHNEVQGKIVDSKVPTWPHLKKMFNKMQEEKIDLCTSFAELYLPNFEDLVHDPIEANIELKYEIKEVNPEKALALTAEEIAMGLQEAYAIIFSQNLHHLISTERILEK